MTYVRLLAKQAFEITVDTSDPGTSAGLKSLASNVGKLDPTLVGAGSGAMAGGVLGAGVGGVAGLLQGVGSGVARGWNGPKDKKQPDNRGILRRLGASVGHGALGAVGGGLGGALVGGGAGALGGGAAGAVATELPRMLSRPDNALGGMAWDAAPRRLQFELAGRNTSGVPPFGWNVQRLLNQAANR